MLLRKKLILYSIHYLVQHLEHVLFRLFTLSLFIIHDFMQMSKLVASTLDQLILLLFPLPNRLS